MPLWEPMRGQELPEPGWAWEARGTGPGGLGPCAGGGHGTGRSRVASARQATGVWL